MTTACASPLGLPIIVLTYSYYCCCGLEQTQSGLIALHLLIGRQKHRSCRRSDRSLTWRISCLSPQEATKTSLHSVKSKDLLSVSLRSSRCTLWTGLPMYCSEEQKQRHPKLDVCRRPRNSCGDSHWGCGLGRIGTSVSCCFQDRRQCTRLRKLCAVCSESRNPTKRCGLHRQICQLDSVFGRLSSSYLSPKHNLTSTRRSAVADSPFAVLTSWSSQELMLCSVALLIALGAARKPCFKSSVSIMKLMWASGIEELRFRASDLRYY